MQMMSSLINDLMDLAKLENNSFKFDEEFFSLPQTVYETFAVVLW